MQYKKKSNIIAAFAILSSLFLQSDAAYARIPMTAMAQIETNTIQTTENTDNADNTEEQNENTVVEMEKIVTNTQTWDSGTDEICKNISVTDEVTRFEVFYTKDCTIPKMTLTDSGGNTYDVKNTASGTQSIAVYSNQDVDGYDKLSYAVIYIANPINPGNWQLSVKKNETHKELFIIQSEVPIMWNTSDVYMTTPKNMICYYFSENSEYSSNDILSIASADNAESDETGNEQYEEVEPVTSEEKTNNIGLILIGVFIVIILVVAFFIYSQKIFADKKEREEGAKKRSIKKKYTSEEDRRRLEKYIRCFDEECSDEDYDIPASFDETDEEDDPDENEDFFSSVSKNPLAYDGFNDGFEDDEYEEKKQNSKKSKSEDAQEEVPERNIKIMDTEIELDILPQNDSDIQNEAMQSDKGNIQQDSESQSKRKQPRIKAKTNQIKKTESETSQDSKINEPEIPVESLNTDIINDNQKTLKKETNKNPSISQENKSKKSLPKFNEQQPKVSSKKIQQDNNKQQKDNSEKSFKKMPDLCNGKDKNNDSSKNDVINTAKNRVSKPTMPNINHKNGKYGNKPPQFI